MVISPQTNMFTFSVLTLSDSVEVCTYLLCRGSEAARYSLTSATTVMMKMVIQQLCVPITTLRRMLDPA